MTARQSQAYVLHLRGFSYNAIGQELGLSRSRASQLVRNALRSIERHPFNATVSRYRAQATLSNLRRITLAIRFLQIP